MSKEIINELVLTLEMALEEIHHPGAANYHGLDITELCLKAIAAAKSGELPPHRRGS